MAEPVKRQPKKPYPKPKFIVYGTVRELRQRDSRGELLSKLKDSALSFIAQPLS